MSQLPSDKEFQLLALVAFKEKTGREVAKQFELDEGKSISYGTLYTTFRRMKEAGWVASRDDQDEDGRVRYFQITDAGLKAMNTARKRYETMAGFGLQTN